MVNLWAAEWHSKCLLDGEKRHIINMNLLPVLFRTRRKCREFIENNYGYINERPDLKAEPHGWRIPQAVKVEIVKIGTKRRISMQGVNLNPSAFADKAQMAFAISDISRYQAAYMAVNNVKGIIVKWRKGWFAIKNPTYGWSFHRPTSFRNMTDALEQRVKEKAAE